MRTAKQIAASRANGAKSTGANTPEGKARIVAANLKSGVYAAYESVEWEDAGQLEELRLEYYARHAPATPEARCLVDELVMCEWSLRRFRRVDTSLFEYGALTRASNDSDENVAVGFASFDKPSSVFSTASTPPAPLSIVPSPNSKSSRPSTSRSATSPATPHPLHPKPSYTTLGVSVVRPRMTPAAPPDIHPSD